MGTITSLLLNVLGGILAGVALIVLQAVYRYWVARRFRNFFGIRKGDPYHIVHTLYNAEPHTKFPLPKSSVTRRPSGSGTNLEQVVSGATVKAVGYLVTAFARETRLSPAISSHTHVDKSMGISFVSVGLLTNFKTVDILDNPANHFVDCVGSPMRIIEKSEQSTIVASQSSTHHDYGLIVKIHPDGDTTRTWICCGGFRTTATRGAAYYLARKWRVIRKWAGDKPFACVIETTVDSDESTRITKIFVERLCWLRRLRKRFRHEDDSFEVIELDGATTGCPQ